jgi:hypothetical protein
MIDHIAAAIARLPQQYLAEGSNVRKFVTALLGPIDAIESALQQLLTLRRVDTATGVTLDAIGKLVGRARNGVADDEIYRRYVRAQIASNISDGLLEQLLTIAELVVYDVAAIFIVEHIGNGALTMHISNFVPSAEVVSTLYGLLAKSVAAGVRIILVFSSAADSDTFFTASAAYVTTAIAPAATSIVVDNYDSLPSAGTVDLGLGTTVANVISYTGKSSPSTLTGVTGVTNSHAIGTAVQLIGIPGKGFDDGTNTVGGQMADAKDV